MPPRATLSASAGFQGSGYTVVERSPDVKGKALVAVVVVKLASGHATARFKLGQATAHPHDAAGK